MTGEKAKSKIRSAGVRCVMLLGKSLAANAKCCSKAGMIGLSILNAPTALNLPQYRVLPAFPKPSSISLFLYPQGRDSRAQCLTPSTTTVSRIAPAAFFGRFSGLL